MPRQGRGSSEVAGRLAMPWYVCKIDVTGLPNAGAGDRMHRWRELAMWAGPSQQGDGKVDPMWLSEQQRQQYRDDGYTVVRGLITPAETDRIRTRLMDFLTGDHDWPNDHFQVLDPSRFRNERDGLVPFGVQRPARREAIFREIADHPNLQSVMTELLGGPITRYTDQALIKHRDVRGESFYHQDSDYWHIPPQRGANAWIALDPVDREAIALAILPGTHRIWEIQPHEAYFDEPALFAARTGEAFKRFRIPLDQIDFSQEVLLPMSPGDTAFFTNYTWHRAEPNLSGQHKAAYAIAYQLQDD